jgi:hypothetical protein
MRIVLMLGLALATLVAGCTHAVMECYLTPHVVGGTTNYEGPCKPAPEGKYPTAKKAK